jgi:16S rRNA (guanine966-N2)-methyltransferase
MRIVAGELKGRRLVAPRGWRVRPTSDRVREAVFSALGDVEGVRVADLFCGTGALAIEALSRGAASAVLVDRDTRPALGNVERLGLRDRAELVRANVSSWLESNAGAAGGDSFPANSRERGPGEGSPPALPPDGRFDLVFVDAPYRLAGRVSRDLDTHLPALLAAGGRAVVESSARAPLEIRSLRRLRQRRYGATDVSFFGEERL